MATKAVAKKPTKAEVALFDEMEGMGDAGFERADADAYAIPFLRILQTNSPQVNEDEESYIKGAKAGMFFNTVTRQVYGKRLKIVPVIYQRDFVEWKPDRGGFVMSHGSDPAVKGRIVERDEKNRDIIDNGNILQDTRNHYVLLADLLKDGPIIFSLSSTGMRHSRAWMLNMRQLKTPGGKEAPMFSTVYEMTTVLNENDDGKWYQVGDRHMTAIVNMGWVNKAQFDAAKAAKDLIASGQTRADYESTVDKKEEAPF